MFNKVFSKNGIDAVYLRLAANDPGEAIRLFKELGISGMNVTSPFKESIVNYLDKIHGAAGILGCVNTIIEREGKLHGYNTDTFGVTQSFKDHGVKLKGKRCLVIGAGGAGKAAAYSMLKSGAEVIMVNRTDSKAKKAAKVIGCKYRDFSTLKELVKKSDIIISALVQNINPVKKRWLNSSQVIFDANYGNSELNSIAVDKGCNIINAEKWLVNQAIRSYEIFLNEKPDKESMKEGLSDCKIAEKKNRISFIGLSGSGKTDTGKALAEKLKYDFIDIDELISIRNGKTIADIFETCGEEHFRELEKSELEERIKSKASQIISCGGGIVLNESVRMTLTKNSIVIWLYASPEIIHKRIDINSRPLLQVEDPLTKLRKLFISRTGHYAGTAHIIFSNEENTINQILKNIIKELNSI